MIVTKIEQLSKLKYKISIDGEFAFVLYKSELSRYRLRENEEITQTVLEDIKQTVLLKRAKQKSLDLLKDMNRTEHELMMKLKFHQYPEDIISKAIAYVKSFHYIDDERYIENYIRSKSGIKSKKEIESLLYAKGLRKEMVQMAFEKEEEYDEISAIQSLLKKRRYSSENADYKEMQKTYAYLMRKGFSYENIRQVL